ncbi:MAG: (d)CMP kinase [Lachnospiraceae bacterium]|nr:(d)CMP kinase [Lachnospiraceae bacterium]
MSFNIAIDGPSGVGKSTIAKKLARDLNFVYIDTGAMFRGLAVYFLENNLDIDDEIAICDAVEQARETIDYVDGEQHVFVNGVDVTDKLRTEAVSRAASVTSQYIPVRKKLLEMQREMAEIQDVIMDGRDIGTVVLPNAHLKIYMVARPEVQAQRRYDQLKESGKLADATFESILADIRERDYRDSHRENAPLRKADDAFEIDTSDFTIEEVLNKIKEHFERTRGESENA